MCDGLRRFVGLVLRVVFFWRAAWVLEGVGCMCDYVVLPLLNSSFEPGRAREVVEGFVDVDLRNIARAELFYFTGQAEECCASCLLAGYVGAVLLHLPTDGMPAFGEYSRMLPEGLRLFATYVMAHHTYLNGEIWSAYGMGKAALFMAERSYPISMTYIHCMMAVCAINRKHKQEAQEEMLRSWELATMEFSIAMLASGGWTNKEIGEHLGISINTVKHYLTDIFCKLNVKKRDELKKFMLK